MNTGLIIFTVFGSICTAAFLVLIGFALSQITKDTTGSEQCEMNHDCDYFEVCNNGHCYLGCTLEICAQNHEICVNEFHGSRCECVPGYVRTTNLTCRYNILKPIRQKKGRNMTITPKAG